MEHPALPNIRCRNQDKPVLDARGLERPHRRGDAGRVAGIDPHHSKAQRLQPLFGQAGLGVDAVRVRAAGIGVRGGVLGVGRVGQGDRQVRRSHHSLVRSHKVVRLRQDKLGASLRRVWTLLPTGVGGPLHGKLKTNCTSHVAVIVHVHIHNNI